MDPFRIHPDRHRRIIKTLVRILTSPQFRSLRDDLRRVLGLRLELRLPRGHRASPVQTESRKGNLPPSYFGRLEPAEFRSSLARWPPAARAGARFWNVRRSPILEGVRTVVEKYSLVVVDQTEMKDDLVQDMVDVLTSFCARFYGRRAAKKRAAKALAAAQAET
jgi:hypothetical protein